jgi:hypothetical protein
MPKDQRPLLKQAGELTLEDFERNPVWAHCHIIDYDQPWYDDTDEETFRPWLGSVPVDPSQAIFLVSATFVFADGGRYRGFVTPAEGADDIGSLQPHVFIQGRCFAFWGGMFAIPVAEREALYATSGRAAKAIFPVRFAGQAGLALGVMSGTLNGFYSCPKDRVICSIVPDNNEMQRTSPG